MERQLRLRPSINFLTIILYGSFFLLLQGLNFLIPVLDKIKYVQSMKEIAIDIPEQSAVTNGKVNHFLISFPRRKSYYSFLREFFVVLLPFSLSAHNQNMNEHLCVIIFFN